MTFAEKTGYSLVPSCGGSPKSSIEGRWLLLTQARSLLWLCLALLATALFTANSGALREDVGLLRHSWHSSQGMPLNQALQAAPGVLLPWDPLLSEEEMQRGITYYGSGARLRQVANKLLSGQPIKAVTLGGSVTAAGFLHRHGRSYSALFLKFLNATFPHSNHTVKNGGMPGSSSGFFAPCLERQVPLDVDIMILEFAINDKAGEPFASNTRRAYEQLMRRALQLPSRPALLLLHHYAWWMSHGDGVKKGLFYREPEGQHTILAQYYDVPSVSLRTAAWRLMQAGVEGFKVDKFLRPGGVDRETKQPIPVASGAEKEHYFYGDIGHPEESGHQALAELLVTPLRRAIQEVAAGLELPTRQDPRLLGLPPAMIPNNPVGATSICAMLEDFKPYVKASQGFRWVPHKPEAPSFKEQKWAWTGLQPGDWVELEFDSRSDGSNPAAQALVQLVHLMSYENMGTAEVACVDGCSCEPKQLDAQWGRRASISSTFLIKVSHHPRCRLRVTIRATASRAEQETNKISISALMVVHYS